MSGPERTTRPALPLIDALRVLAHARGDAVVVTTMGSAREWPKISNHPLDFVYVPSSMGQAPSLGLGLALAQPRRRVIVVNGDGCLLMNLGCLITITAAAPRNYTLVVVDNGVYEVTGAQPTAASGSAREGHSGIDFCALARASGFGDVQGFSDPSTWNLKAAEVLHRTGPVFVNLVCQPLHGDVAVTAPSPMRDRLARFRYALRSS